MQKIVALALFFLTQPQVAPAQVYTTPVRGSDLRADLMDALRPLVEHALGAPVEFVVHDLRVSGEIAFANVSPQRPGGGVIANPEGDVGFDGVTTQALYRREGDQWVVMQFAIGATDAWWSDPALCLTFHPVIPEACP